MNRKLLFFPATAIVWAQQTSPSAEEAKQALTNRVQQYYQFLLDKKYRQAEAFVAEESRDYYYESKKPDVKGFDISKVELGPDGTTAVVTVKTKMIMLMMGLGAQVFEFPTPSHWKLENGVWCWYLPDEVRNATPFGQMNTNPKAGAASSADGKGKAPEFRALVNQVTIDKTSVELSAGKTDEEVVIENGLPGTITLRMDPHAQQIRGLKVELDKQSLDSGGKAIVRLHWDGAVKVADVVEIVVFPINRTFDIGVRAEKIK